MMGLPGGRILLSEGKRVCEGTPVRLTPEVSVASPLPFCMADRAGQSQRHLARVPLLCLC